MSRDQACQELTRSRSSWPCVGETVRAHKYVSLPLPGATGANGRWQSHTHPPGGRMTFIRPNRPIIFDTVICQGFKTLTLEMILQFCFKKWTVTLIFLSTFFRDSQSLVGPGQPQPGPTVSCTYTMFSTDWIVELN